MLSETPTALSKILRGALGNLSESGRNPYGPSVSSGTIDVLSRRAAREAYASLGSSPFLVNDLQAVHPSVLVDFA